MASRIINILSIIQLKSDQIDIWLVRWGFVDFLSKSYLAWATLTGIVIHWTVGSDLEERPDPCIIILLVRLLSLPEVE
jgi:hypothetical protein